MDRRLPLAHSLVLVGPTLLLGGALYLQHFSGLPPCEMCIWQRWPHFIAIVLGLVALPMVQARRPLVMLAALAVWVSAGIAVYHLGVEQHWWQGPTACTSGLTAGADMLKSILAAPVVRCDAIPFVFLGLSLAAWNALFSGAIGAVVLWLTARR